MGCCYSATRSNNDAPPKPQFWKPLKKRSCTDVIPLCVFVLFFAGMITITAFAIASGAAGRLINGYDSYGNTCDKRNKKLTEHPNSGLDLTGRKFVFFMDVLDPRDSLEICVKKCPDRLLLKDDLYKFYEETGSELCDYSIPPNEYGSQENGKTGPCPHLPVEASSPIIYRCVPTDITKLVVNFVTFVNNLDPLSRILGDIYMCRYAIIGLCFFAVLVSFVVVLLIRYLASIVVYIINIVVALSALVGTGLLWWMYASAKLNLNKPLNTTYISEQENADTFLWYSIFATVFTVIILLLILVMRKRVALTVDLFHEAGRCLAYIPFLLLQPLWTFLVLILFWMSWLVVFGFLATAGEPVMVNEHEGWIRYNETAVVRYMWWYHVIGLIWVSEFILACQQMTIAGAVAKFYFTRDKKNLGNPIISSISRLIANHIGSCALGSFIIVLVKIPRCILMYIERQIRDSKNIIAKILVKCCIVCLCILEKCLRYLNYNAYSLVAINGTNFCKSACDAVSTLLSNALRVIAINSVGAFVLFLGKLVVVAVVAGIGSVLVLKYHPNIHHVAVPVGVVAVFSYLTAHCFLSIYEMAIDTLLLCFCEDCRVNNGTPGKEYFMPKSLMVYVKNSSKQINALEGKKEKNSEEEERLHTTPV